VMTQAGRLCAVDALRLCLFVEKIVAFSKALCYNVWVTVAENPQGHYIYYF